MGVNPFEPPRSGDAGDLSAAGGVDVLSDEALRELVASAPWARWTARLGLASGSLSVVYSVLALGRATKPAETLANVGSLVITIPMLVVWVVLARRFADHAERLANREPRALAGVVYAQRAIFRTQVLLALAGAAVGMLLAIAGVAIGTGK